MSIYDKTHRGWRVHIKKVAKDGDLSKYYDARYQRIDSMFISYPEMCLSGVDGNKFTSEQEARDAVCTIIDSIIDGTCNEGTMRRANAGKPFDATQPAAKATGKEMIDILCGQMKDVMCSIQELKKFQQILGPFLHTTNFGERGASLDGVIRSIIREDRDGGLFGGGARYVQIEDSELTGEPIKTPLSNSTDQFRPLYDGKGINRGVDAAEVFSKSSAVIEDMFYRVCKRLEALEAVKSDSADIPADADVSAEPESGTNIIFENGKLWLVDYGAGTAKRLSYVRLEQE